jgi:hypothetical protein
VLFFFTFLEVSIQAVSNSVSLDQIFCCNKSSFKMSGESDDLVDIDLSETSDGSNEQSTQDYQYPSPELSTTTGPYYSAGIIPVDEPILVSGLDSTEEPSSTTESGWTTEPTSSTQPASTTQPTDNSAARNKTWIHPISEGGSVTWKDHNNFVFHKGKDRGPRAPAPPLPENYKSKGPLPNFDFSKLRGNNVCMKPLFDSLATPSFEADNYNRLGSNL